jgi:hypothetical protein
MLFKSCFIIFIVSVLVGSCSFAQEIVVRKDSAQFYKHIENYSRRNKVFKFIYPLVFNSCEDNTQKKEENSIVYKNLINKSFSSFEGKTIRHIIIKSLDPFGYSIEDTIALPRNFLHKTGNSLHIKSNHSTIRNLLLIKQNQVFDSLLVKESERLVRSQRYVQDVLFTIKATSQNSDSVDIYIRVKDNWSIIPEIGGSTSQLDIELTDKNFLGMGHESRNSISWHQPKGVYTYNLNYYIPNIQNTYINLKLHYGTDEFGNFVKSFAVDRPFFSPFAKWAAGVRFIQELRNDSLLGSDLVYKTQGIKFNTQDYWAGMAFRIFKGNSENNRTTNLISSLRYFRISYLEKPFESLDPLKVYSNENFYLASVGISMRKYVQDKYIFRYGVKEDVPIGKVYSLTTGYQKKNNSGRIYLGARFSFGNYYQWGYLSSNFEYGTFFRKSNPEQGAFTINVIYFTGLLEIGKWKFRQFLKPQITIGINRFADDSLTLNDGVGLDGFNSPLLSGTRRLLCTSQTQFYSPWKLLGFRFGPYLVYSLGMLGNATDRFSHSKVYSQIGFGVLIKNENFVFNTFQVSIAFYPIIPGNGSSIFKMNSFKTTDFGFRDFEIGKPSVLVFR